MNNLIKINQYHLAVQTSGEVGVRLNYLAPDINDIVVKINDVTAPASAYEWRFNGVAVLTGQVLANSKLYWIGSMIAIDDVIELDYDVVSLDGNPPVEPQVIGDLIPDIDATHSIGSTAKQFLTAHFSSNTLYIGGQEVVFGPGGLITIDGQSGTPAPTPVASIPAQSNAPTQTPSNTPSNTPSSSPSNTPSNTPSQSMASLIMIANVPQFRFNNDDIRIDFENNGAALAADQRFNIDSAQTGGILDARLLEEMLDNAFADMNYGYNNNQDPYTTSPPITFSGAQYSNLGYYGNGIADPDVGQQLYNSNAVPLSGEGAAWVFLGVGNQYNDMLAAFTDVQLNGGTTRFIGWDAGGQVTEVLDIITDPILGLDQYWPLFKLEADANGYAQGNGNSHTHQITNTASGDILTWYMPDGLPAAQQFHGTYPGQGQI